jgi:hypothetical protein
MNALAKHCFWHSEKTYILKILYIYKQNDKFDLEWMESERAMIWDGEQHVSEAIFAVPMI